MAITDAMTMEGVGKGYTTEQSSVLAVKAGADILLKPSDATRAIDAVVAAVERGEISRARIDSAARHILELKARAGLAANRIVSLERLREVVGAPEHRAAAASIARRSLTLLRDRDNLVPMTADSGRTLIVRYAPETEIKAGRVVRGGDASGRARSAAIGDRSRASVRRPRAICSTRSLAWRTRASTVIVTAYVRRVEGAGRVAVPQPIASWIDALATRRRVIVVAFGNPYLLGQFPNVGSYLAAYARHRRPRAGRGSGVDGARADHRPRADFAAGRLQSGRRAPPLTTAVRISRTNFSGLPTWRARRGA